MRIVLTSAALIAAFAAPAFAAPATHHFTRDGEDYSYAASRADDGSVMLTGRVEGTGEAFRLHVAGRRVAGQMGTTPVAFVVSKDTAERLDREVTADATVSGAMLASN